MSSLTPSSVHFTTLNDMLLHRASSDPDQGITYLPQGEGDEEHLSFSRLDLEARRIGRALSEISRPGDRIVLLFGEGTDVILAFFGALYAGLVTLPVAPPRPNQPKEDLLALLSDAEATLVLTTRQMHPLLTAAVGEASMTIRLLEDLQMSGSDDPASWVPVAVAPSDLATLLYTSGSTSRPRGVILSHGHLTTRLQALSRIERAGEDLLGELTVSWMPLFHVWGLLGAVLQPMYMNRRTVVLPTSAVIARPIRWLRAISHYRAAGSGAPNFAFQACLDSVSAEERAGLDLSCWKVAPLGAETIRADTLRQFADRYASSGFSSRAFCTAYGMSEGLATFDTSTAEHKPICLVVERKALEEDRVVIAAEGEWPAAQLQTLVSCGPPMTGQRLLIVDPGTLIPLADHMVGEIWNSGPLISDGYWRQPEQTARTFQARLASGEGPFLRTGDLGFLHAGELYVTGRLKDMLIIRGKNIYAVDLEQAAEQAHLALLPAASAAFSVPVGQEEGLVLVHEVRPEYADLDVGEVSAAIRRHIGNVHQLPVHAVVLIESGTLPRTQTGKLQRYRCREQYLAAVAGAPTEP